MIKYLILLSLLIPSLAHSLECTEEIDKLSQTIKVPIFCNLSSYELDNEKISGIEPDKRLLNDFYPVLEQFVRDNGSEFIRTNVPRIILLQNLRLNGTGVGGLSNGQEIIVNIKYCPQSDLRRIYLAVLNHEMSSCVMQKAAVYKLFLWRQVGLIYNYSKQFFLECLRNSDFAFNVNEYLLENGFLSNYSLTSTENDFNTYAERLFTRDPVIMGNGMRYKKVKEKLQLLKQIYREAGFKGKFPDET